MEKISEIMLLILIPISFCILGFGYYKLSITTNQKRYNETPLMSEIEGSSKEYMLDYWLNSGLELKFITQELIGENTLVYYFEVIEPDYFYVFGVREHYIKAVYKFKSIGIPLYKSWKFDVVWISSYDEIQTILEVNNA